MVIKRTGEIATPGEIRAAIRRQLRIMSFVISKEDQDAAVAAILTPEFIQRCSGMYLGAVGRDGFDAALTYHYGRQNHDPQT